MSSILSSTNLCENRSPNLPMTLSSAVKKRKCPGGDRFIPSRSLMEQAQSVDSFLLEPPKTAYQAELMKVFFPNYSRRTLRCASLPVTKYKVRFPVEKSFIKIPSQPFKLLDAPGIVNNLCYNNLDFGRLLIINMNKASYASNVDTGEIIYYDPVNVNQPDFSSIKINPNEESFARGNANSCLQVINVETRQKIYELPNVNLSTPIYSIDWKTPQELTVGSYGVIRHIDTRSRLFGRTITTGTNTTGINQTCSLKWNQSKRCLAAGDTSGHVRIYDLSGVTKVMNEYVHKAGVKALQWNPDHPAILMSGGWSVDKILKVYDFFSGKIVCEAPMYAPICCMSWLNRDIAVIGLGSGELQYWKYKDRGLKKEGGVPLTDGRILDIAKDPNSSKFCSLASAEVLKFWEPTLLQNKPESQEPLFGVTIR